ncbi:hypothetical protein GCM10011428_23560 [Streptomyces violaceus]
MDDRPTSGALSPNHHSVLEDALALFEVDLNPDDLIHRQAGQLANLCVQVFGDCVTLMAETDEYLPTAARDPAQPHA